MKSLKINLDTLINLIFVNEIVLCFISAKDKGDHGEFSL